MKANKRINAHYFVIVIYGIMLLTIMLGKGNLYGSVTDWLGQHIVFPELFRQAFYESKQLIPNLLFQIGGGQNAFLFTYYGFLSPVILISYLLPFIDMTTYVISASIGLYLMTGVFVYIFLKRHFDRRKALAASLLFMTLPPINYHFHHHIMFVWYLPFLMLGLIGLDYYFEKKMRILFIGSVFCMILTNYYFSVGGLLCLFVYAVYSILKKEGLPLTAFVRQVRSVVYLFALPVLLSAFVLFPTAYALFTNSRSHAVSEEMKNLFVPNPPDIFFGSYGMGITGLILIAIIGNLINKNLKKCDVFLNAFLIVIIACPVVSYILNGMLYVRGKVLIPFSVLAVYAFCLFIERLERYWKYAGVLYVYTLAILLLASFANLKSEEYVSQEVYKELYNEEIVELMKHAEGNWYRTNVSYLEKHLGNRTYGNKFYGSSVYSSTSNSLYQEFYESYMGNNEKYRNCFMVCGAQNELFYTFMGTKYIIAETDPGFFYEKVAESEHLSLYKNQSAYPIMYKSSRTFRETEFDKLEFPYTAETLMTHTVVDNVNYTTYESSIESCDVVENYQFTQKKGDKYEIELGERYRDKILYLTFEVSNEGEYNNKKDISISINGIKNKLTADSALYYNGNTKFDYVIPLENTTLLTVEITKGQYDIRNLHMYISPIILKQYSEVEDMEMIASSNEIRCRADAEKQEYLVTSIPYDKGFSVYVNGKQKDVEVVNKAFVGAQLEAGENEVIIRYESPFFHLGMGVSMVGLLLVTHELLRGKIQMLIKRHREVAMYLLFGVLTTIVSFLTYLICTTFVLDTDYVLQLQMANIISWIVSVTFAYITNKRYVFQSHGEVAKELVKFYISRLGTLIIEMGLMYVMVAIWNMNDLFAKIVVQIIVIASNYMFSKFLVFGEGKYK